MSHGDILETLARRRALVACHHEHHPAHCRDASERDDRESNAHSSDSYEDRDRRHDRYATRQHQPASVTALLLSTSAFLNLVFIVRLMMRHSSPPLDRLLLHSVKLIEPPLRQPLRRTMIGFDVAAVS